MNEVTETALEEAVRPFSFFKSLLLPLLSLASPPLVLNRSLGSV
jgi:hypothetical protein